VHTGHDDGVRAPFALLTALPLGWDPDEVADGWTWTPLVGLAIGVAWLLFHQAASRLGGPFVAAAGTLLLHQAMTGARPMRGLAGVVTATLEDPDADRARGLPDAQGAATAVVTLVLVAMSGFVILVDTAPAVLVLVPLLGRSAQVLLLGEVDVEVGVAAPSPRQRLLVLVGTAAAFAAPPLLALAVRPERLDVSALRYLMAGALALLVSLAAAAVARAWLRARFGPMDANGWHAVAAVADLAALAAVVGAVG
jgi:cobalamin synthase